jgi:hypothetical protein
MTASTAEKKLREKLTKLHRMLGSANAHEREAAFARIDEILTRRKKTWNDLTDILSGAGGTQGWHDDDDDDGDVADPPARESRRPAPLDLIYHILARHLGLTEHQLVAVTLWIAHTFVFERFSVTPRLAALSPVRGCGKTTLLNTVKALSKRTRKVDHITAAVLFRLIDRERSTLLLDEADNQDLLHNPVLRSVINSGHHRDGKVMRYLDGEVSEFSTFAPLALAAIGRLPFPMLHRSIVINMERSSAELVRFDPNTIAGQQDGVDIVYGETFRWASQCQLELDPGLPHELRNRPADNWRPLIAVADACNSAWGTAARVAALALSKHQDEDLSVILLADIRGVFDRKSTLDRLSSAMIVDELNEMTDAPWSEWRGPRDDQAPRRFTQAQLAAMLAPFGIRPRTIWPPHRGASKKSTKGYLRAQFEAAWAAYCDGNGTPAQTNNVSFLHHDGRRGRH